MSHKKKYAKVVYGDDAKAVHDTDEARAWFMKHVVGCVTAVKVCGNSTVQRTVVTFGEAEKFFNSVHAKHKRSLKQPVKNTSLRVKRGVKTDFTGLPDNPFDPRNWC